MMKKYLLSLGLAIVLLTSCKDDELPLTPDLVTSVKAFDLDNNGNASDIRVDFKVENNRNVMEYRVMILQSKDSSSFTLSIAQSIPEINFLRFLPVTLLGEWSINRLPSSLPDVNGELIRNNVEYVIAILVV